MTGLRLTPDINQEFKEIPENIEHFWSLGAGPDSKKPIHKIYQEINRLFRKANKAKARGAERASRTKRKKLKKLIKRYVNNERGSLPSIAVALLAWVVARCERGISGDAIKFTSVLRYKSEVLRPLLNLFHSHQWLAFTEVEFETIYFDALNWGKRSDKGWRVRVIRDFHLFLESQISVESPDWTALFSYAGARVPQDSIDANLLTEIEYFRCLEIVRNDDLLPLLVQQRYALALILGYRFGLRISEVIQLRYSDVQENNHHMFIQVVTNVFGEKKSTKSLRQIPLIGKINEYEQEIVKRVMDQCAINFVEDRQALLINSDEARVELDGNRMSGYLNRLLKHVSGDPGLHFHHLRHGWVMRMMAIAFPNRWDSLWARIRIALVGVSGTQDCELLWGDDVNTAVKIRAISDAVGHVSESTSLSSYFHLHDFMASDLIQSEESYPSVQGYVYALLSNYGVLNGRIASNNTLGSREKKILKAEKIEKLFRNSVEELQEFTQTPPWVGSAPQTTSLTLNKIDRLLTVMANRNGSLEGLYELFGVPLGKLYDIIEVADSLETRSGYERYSVALAVNDPLLTRANEVITAEPFNVDETKRFREFSLAVESSLEKLNEMDRNSIEPGIDAWARAHQPNTKIFMITSLSQLKSLFDLFGLLNIFDYKAELKLNHQDRWPREVRVELERYHINTRHVSFRIAPVDKSTAHKSFNLPIRISEISNGIKTVDAFNRLMFCLRVLLDSQK